jgi:hypothetical protein
VVSDQPVRVRWPLVLALVIAAVVGGFVLWLQAGLMVAFGYAAAGGMGLQDNLSAAAEELVAGDYAAGDAAYREASASAERVFKSWDIAQVALIKRIPPLEPAVRNWERVASGSVAIAQGTGELLSLYGDLSGKTTGERIFSDGSINTAMLEELPDRVTTVIDRLNAAERNLTTIEARSTLTQPLDGMRATALTEMQPVRQSVDAIADIAPVLPGALGADGPRRYLVAIGNQAEMRASGGAPLTLVMVEFNQGRISIPVKGQTSTQLFPPLNAPVTWFGPGPNPFFPGNARFAPFVVTNTHPNYVYSAQEMAASWAGGGYPKVDGVVFLDLTAIGAVLNATGPVESAVYGTVTGDQLGQILLIDAYATFGQEAADQRQAANQQLLDELMARLLSGDDLVNVAQAIASTVPGRHFQVWMREPRLQQLSLDAGAAGYVSDPKIGDWSAVYTQNGNQSKVDVFQQRNTLMQVALREDGSAGINQVITITNETPPDRPEGPPERIGYETMWVKNAHIIYIPNAAQAFRASFPSNFSIRPFKGHARQQAGNGFVSDGLGHRLVRVVGWTPPGGSAQIVVSYELPPGTFSAVGGSPEQARQPALVYRLRAEPQSVFVPPTLSVTVIPPPGYRVTPYTGMQVTDGAATVSAVLDRPVEIGMEFTR